MVGRQSEPPRWGFVTTSWPLPPADLISVRVVQQQVEIARRAAKFPEQQGDLSAVMNGMIGAMLHQFSQRLR